MTKPKTLKEWERVCNNLNKALQSTIEDVLTRDTKIDNLEGQVGKLEEQITMSVGVIKYLELQLEKKSGR
jgi:uncharacterized protein (DUF3084 family)